MNRPRHHSDQPVRFRRIVGGRIVGGMRLPALRLLGLLLTLRLPALPA